MPLVKLDDCLPRFPCNAGESAGLEIGNRGLLQPDLFSDFRLGEPVSAQVGNECLPVHADIIGKPMLKGKRFADIYQRDNPAMTTMTFGERLRSCRTAAKLTQVQVSTRTGVSQNNLSELEKGRYPTSAFVPALADLYGVNALWLAEGKGPRASDRLTQADVDAAARGLTQEALALAISWAALDPAARAQVSMMVLGLAAHGLHIEADQEISK